MRRQPKLDRGVNDTWSPLARQGRTSVLFVGSTAVPSPSPTGN